jgi:hypothetical protein
MRTSESAKPENSRIFYRDFNESEYTLRLSTSLLYKWRVQVAVLVRARDATKQCPRLIAKSLACSLLQNTNLGFEEDTIQQFVLLRK